VPEASLGWWRRRLAGLGVVHEDPSPRLDEEVLTFLDPDGLKLELVAHAGAAERAPWADGPVAERYAVRGFHSVTLREADAEATAGVLSAMGFSAAGEAGRRHRFAATPAAEGAQPGAMVDLLVDPNGTPGHVAAGTVHHVAWRAADDADQLAWRGAMVERGLHVTPVVDRSYFRSIYFREPGGVLFEIATDPPGFAIDETVAELGSGLRLPPWLEPHRQRIEGTLPPLRPPAPVETAQAGAETATEGAA
jgi:glyoxalase family protein